MPSSKRGSYPGRLLQSNRPWKRWRLDLLAVFCLLMPLAPVKAMMRADPVDGPNEARALNPVSYRILSGFRQTFNVDDLGHPFEGKENSIVRVVPQIKGLAGIRLSGDFRPVDVTFSQPAWLLIGVFHSNDGQYLQMDPSADFNGTGRLIIKNGLTITGLPRVDIYAFRYSEGAHAIQPGKKGLYTILGAVAPKALSNVIDGGLPDGRQWRPYRVDGAVGDALFQAVGGPDAPVIDEGMAGTEGILGGFEGGRCVKVGDTYHLFPTERAGEQGVEAYYDRVKTRIGHWTSKDAIHWKRRGTLYQASGHYAVSDYDNPVNDRRGAIWSFLPVFNKKENRWNAFYLAYTVSREIDPNHSFGRIWQAKSVVKGPEGVGGPYKDQGIVMEPGLNSQLWEGRQGVDSFFPFKAGDQWLAFYGGAYPWHKWSDYPDKPHKGAWYVGLAHSDSLDGPWARMDTTVNPVTSIHPYFIENPIVSQLPNGTYIAIFDGGPDAWGLHLPNMFGYSLSVDGRHWSKARYIPIRTKVKKWWDIMRTPLGLIPEGDHEYTVPYAAITANKRFHPIGLVRLKLNPEVLETRTEALEKQLN